MFGELNKNGVLKRNILLLLFLVIISGSLLITHTFAQSNNKYTIVGNSVEWNNSYGFIRVTPHTINGPEGCFNVTIKSSMATQDLDCALIADSNKLQLTSSKYLTTTSGNVSYNFTCPTTNFSYTTNPNQATCYADNGTLLFNGSFESGDLVSRQVFWNVWTSTDAWTDIPANRINKASYNFRDIYAVTAVNFAQNTEKTIKVCGNAVSKFTTEKFDVGCKRSTDNWSSVIASGNYIIVDPIWNYTDFVNANIMAGSCSSSGPFSISYMAGFNITINRINISIANVTIHPDCLPNNVRLYFGGQDPNGLSIHQYNLTGNQKIIPFNYTVNNSLSYYLVASGPTGHGSNYTLTYANGDAGCPTPSIVQPSPYATVTSSVHTNTGVWNNLGSVGYCFTNITFANTSDIDAAPGANQSESDYRTAIVSGITNKIPLAQIYTGQQIYVRYLNGTQSLGTFDKVAVYGNQRWAFNAITGSEQITNMINLTPSFYVLETNTSLSTTVLQSQVEALINSTLAS